MFQVDYLVAWLQARLGVTSDRGASLVEYVLMVSLIAMVCLAVLSYFGGQSDNSLTRSKNSIVGAG